MRFLTDIGLFPEQASTMAARVDALYFGLVGLSALLSLIIFTCVIVFAVRYRRRAPGQVGEPSHGGLVLEAVMLLIPVPIVLGLFLWSAWVFVAIADAPDDALEVYGVGKQWMWKLQHATGQKEINTLHVPVGRDVRLTLTSQDVIHDFFVPAFRLKTDVVPGRYTTLWFNATAPGRYHLFCAEYCGTDHSRMTGEIVVLTPRDYEAWLARGAGDGTLAAAGRALFQDLACDSCHRLDAQGRGPMLTNVFGASVLLQTGERVVADESYLRESILNPGAQVVAGFLPIMPPFQGLVSEEQVLQLVEYIKSLSATGEAVQQPPVPPATQLGAPVPGSRGAATGPAEPPR